MKQCALELLLLCLMAVSAAAAGEDLDRPVIFLIQQDLNPEITPLNPEAGLKWLLGHLPSETRVMVVVFRLEEFDTVLNTTAGEAMKGFRGFRFSAKSQNSLPIESLLAFLSQQEIRDQAVYFVSNSYSQAMMQKMQLGRLNFTESQLTGFVGPDQRPSLMQVKGFDPDKYPPLPQLRQYCKDRKVRIMGVFVAETPVHSASSPGTIFPGDMSTLSIRYDRRNLALESLGFTALQWITRETGGEIYYDFPTFQGLFEVLAAEGRFNP